MKISWFTLLLLMVVFVSCKDEASDPVPVASPNVKVNNWIYETMGFWYYWNQQLPTGADKSQDPETFFKSLLSSEDRFSWIQPNYEELVNSLQGISKEAGFEFVLYKESEGSSNVIAQILYIKPNSPASSAGLKRGDVITHINDQQMTTSNYRTLIAEFKNNHTIKYKPLLVGQNAFDQVLSASIQPVEYAENPNYFSTVIDLDGRKVGYYVYNFFATGTNGYWTCVLIVVAPNLPRKAWQVSLAKESMLLKHLQGGTTMHQ
jgi:carboxyl-terminal processing protease